MTTETARPKQTTTPDGTEAMKDFFGDMWGTTLDMQRQWLGLWTRPFGSTPMPDQLWQEWHKFNAELLDLNRKTSELTHQFVNDQVKIGRQFTDKTRTMKWDAAEPKETAPEFTRELLDTARKTTKRSFTFGNETLKTFEEFGLNLSETMMRVPTQTK